MKRSLLELFFIAAPKIAAGVCTVGINLLLVRYFGPEQFGVYSLCLSFILLSDAIIGSAIDMSVLRLAPLYKATHPELSLAVQKMGLLLKCGIALLLFLILTIAARTLAAKFFHQDGVALLLFLSCLAASGLLLLRSAQVHLQVQEKFALYGALDLLHNVLKFGGIALCMVFYRVSPGLVLALFAFGPSVAFLCWASTSGSETFRQSARQPSLARELVGFVKWYLPTFSLAALMGRLDVICLSLLCSIGEVGIFSAGQIFALIPQLVGSYLAVLFSPRIMPSYSEGRFSSFYVRFQLGTLVVCVAFYACAVVGLSTAAPTLWPTAFARSAGVTLTLLPGALAGCMMLPLTVTFLMFVRPKFLFTMDCIALPLAVPAYLYAIKTHGAVGAAFVSSALSLMKAAAAQIVAWRAAHTSIQVFKVSPLLRGQEIAGAVGEGEVL